VRRRILIAITSVAAVAVLVFAIPFAVTVRNLTIQDELNELERSANRISRAIEPERVNRLTNRSLGNRDEFTVGVYNRSAHKVTGAGPQRLEGDLRRSLKGRVVRHVGDTFRVAVPVGGKRARGIVRATTPASGADSRVLGTWFLLGGFGLLAVAAAAGLAWWLSRRLDAPLTRLASSARRIGDGDFTSRVPRSGVGEIDEVAEAIDTTAQRLGDALERERSFSAHVSHQLRTAIAGVRITLERALLTGGSERESIAQAIEETDRLTAVVDDMLVLRRDAPRDRAALDAEALLEAVRERWHGRLAALGRPLRVSAGSDLPTVRASSAAVLQILEVLVDNAGRHGRGEIRVIARAAPDGLAIDVSDEGPGIADDGDVVFARRSGDDTHGIGLSLARALAEAEGGRLVLTSRHPGARFTLLLPTSHAD
jgi:signal transduction histidine kinase